jgi:hypothetical protein
MFADGCKPWYAPNGFDDSVWWKPPCPKKNPSTGFEGVPANNEGAPWRCVVKAPGFSPPVIADGIAAAIGNCVPNKSESKCSPSTSKCNNPNFYDKNNPGEWALHGGEPSPRVVYIFIVPYGAYKNTGSQETIPILTFAAFYVTGWEGNGGNANPCVPDPDGSGPALADEDPTADPKDKDKGDIVGYFVDYTLPDAPGDPNAVCELGLLLPCVPVLVR